MSNSVFLFMVGLTLGILISLSLVNRYKNTHPAMTMEKVPNLSLEKHEKSFGSLQDGGGDERNANFADFKGDTTSSPHDSVTTSSVTMLAPPESSTTEEQNRPIENIQSASSRTKRNKPM